MANPPKDDGQLIEGQIDRRSSQPLRVQKFMAKSSPVALLRIGAYEVRSRNEPHLTARWYYSRKQLNWEILENKLKKKITIDWSIISAIRVAYGGDPEILEIELDKPPAFFSEVDGRLTIYSTWIPSSDFTGDQASTYRIHHLEFPHGLLERKMEPLFILDSRLKKSIGRPFPSFESPFFAGSITGTQPVPPLLINSQLLQHHQMPPDHSSVPVCSNNSNLMDLVSTAQQSGDRASPSHEDSQVSDYGYPQPPSSLPRSGTMPDPEPRVGQSAPRSGTPLDLGLRLGPPAHNATASSYNPDDTKYAHEGHHPDDHPNTMTASDDPSCTGAGMDIAHHAHTRDDQAE